MGKRARCDDAAKASPFHGFPEHFIPELNISIYIFKQLTRPKTPSNGTLAAPPWGVNLLDW